MQRGALVATLTPCCPPDCRCGDGGGGDGGDDRGHGGDDRDDGVHGGSAHGH